MKLYGTSVQWCYTIYYHTTVQAVNTVFFYDQQWRASHLYSHF